MQGTGKRLQGFPNALSLPCLRTAVQMHGAGRCGGLVELQRALELSMVATDVPPASPLSQLQPTFRAEYGGLLRCRRCSRCLPASGQAGHRLGGCQVAWGARELRRRRPSQTPQWTPGRVPSAALPEAAAAFPSGLIVHVVVFCAGMNVSVVRSAGGGRWSNPPSPPGASRVRGGVLHRIYDEYGSQKARHTRFLALFQPQLVCPQHRNTQS